MSITLISAIASRISSFESAISISPVEKVWDQIAAF